jgi:tyrosine-protein phosphatase
LGLNPTQGIMPSAATRRVYEDQIPSFMTVFDLDAETMADRDTVTVMDAGLVDPETKPPTLANGPQQHALIHGAMGPDASHKHHDSTSTQMSESADSSPTTTLSTTDSSPLTDPSPSSSPDSPVNLVPLNNYPSTTFGSRLGAPPPPAESTVLCMGSRERPMTSPSPRRPRNMKGLSIQPPAAASSATSSTLVSEPSSPCFIKPKIPAMKRKPSQLSLKTSTSDLVNRSVGEVPPSPVMPPILQRRALKHSTSSPHMLTTIKSATFGPGGGMTLPRMLERNESGLSEVLRPMKSSMNTTFDSTITEEDSPIKPQMANRSDFEPYGERVNNEDEKTPGYPNGPIAMYGDEVYLYLEPSAEEAAKFDVVINVAREVRNPFDRPQPTRSQPNSYVPDLSPIPDTAVTTSSFATAFEVQPTEDSRIETPTTPKANHFKQPEYIHIPWDHNTDIASDLMHLCETIDQRTKEGKRVLVHCQQGASRSASLIIAYGMYQRPELTVNDAYYAAQAKSQWISPNMKLMYSLQDFQKQVSRKRLSPPSSFRPGRSPTKHRLTLSADAIDVPPKEPRTAPLPGEEEGDKADESAHPESRRRGNSTPGLQQVSPGPASAPPNMNWKEDVETKTWPSQPMGQVAELPERPKPEYNVQESFSAPFLAPPPPPPSRPPPPTPGFGPPAGFGSFPGPSFPKRVSSLDPLPRKGASSDRIVPMAPSPPYEDTIMSPRAETMTKNPLHDIAQFSGMRFVEAPPTPTVGLFSPRATLFPRNALSPFGRPGHNADPRSPPTVGETPITRSIDDIL